MEVEKLIKAAPVIAKKSIPTIKFLFKTYIIATAYIFALV